MTPPPTHTAAPRWSTLLGLIAAVLGVHMAMLLGPLPGTSLGAASGAWSPAPASAMPTLKSHPSGGAPAAAADLNPPTVSVSTVRWIVPAPPVAPASPPDSKSAPRAVAVAQATVRATAPGREVRPLPTTAAAEEAPVVETVAMDATRGMGAQPPYGPVARAETTPSDSAPMSASEETALNDPAAPPADTLFAAASAKEQAASPAAGALPPAQPPASTRLDYAVTGRVKGIAYNAEGQLDWTLSDGRYGARMEMRVFLLGSRVQTSTGRAGPTGLMPERFSDRSRSEKAAHFDAEQNRIRFSNNAPDAVLQPGAQDRLSLFLQIAGLLQARPQAYASGQTIEMQVVGTGDADTWRFEVGDEVTLVLPAGELRARPLKRLPRKAFDSTVEMWLAPELQHLPVRLRVTQANGDVADQQLSRMP